MRQSAKATLKAAAETHGVFVLIIGGSGSGKNFIHSREFPEIPLVDTDKIVKDIAGDDADLARKSVSRAVHDANRELRKYFSRQESVAQVSTGSGFKGAFNKLQKAKDSGLKTAVVLVDSDPNEAIERNRRRAAAGEQFLVPDWKVKKTNLSAKETFRDLENSEVVDYSFAIKN